MTVCSRAIFEWSCVALLLLLLPLLDLSDEFPEDVAEDSTIHEVSNLGVSVQSALDREGLA